MLIQKSQSSKIKLCSYGNQNKISFSFSRFVENKELLPTKVNLIIPLQSFGISEEETISDKDGRQLYILLKDLRWKLDKRRITDRMQFGDLFAISPNKKRFIFEITKEGKEMEISGQIRKFLRQRLAGKAFLQATKAKNQKAQYVMVLWKGLLEKNVISEDFLSACRSHKIKLIFTKFERNWEKEVISRI